MGVVFIAILGGLLFGYDTAVISGAEQALQKHLGLDAFWHGVTASSALIGCVIGSAFSGYFASGLGRRNSLRLAALLFFLPILRASINNVFSVCFLWLLINQSDTGICVV